MGGPEETCPGYISRIVCCFGEIARACVVGAGGGADLVGSSDGWDEILRACVIGYGCSCDGHVGEGAADVGIIRFGGHFGIFLFFLWEKSY